MRKSFCAKKKKTKFCKGYIKKNLHSNMDLVSKQEGDFVKRSFPQNLLNTLR